MKPLLSLGLFLITSLFFYFYSEIDLIVARYFYNEALGGFYFNEYPAVEVIYQIFKHLPKLLLPMFLVFFILSLKNKWCQKRRKIAAFALITLLIGPGIIVHNVFKDQWDRARPRHLVEFGGEKQFTPAWVISDQCERNCSFVSGHAAMGFYAMILGWLLASRRWFYIGLAIGAVVGMIRVVQGGHFLSDTILAGFIVYWTIWLFAKWMSIPNPGEKNNKLDFDNIRPVGNL